MTVPTTEQGWLEALALVDEIEDAIELIALRYLRATNRYQSRYSPSLHCTKWESSDARPFITLHLQDQYDYSENAYEEMPLPMLWDEEGTLQKIEADLEAERLRLKAIEEAEEERAKAAQERRDRAEYRRLKKKYE